MTPCGRIQRFAPRQLVLEVVANATRTFNLVRGAAVATDA
jgi:hypothetical protein